MKIARPVARQPKPAHAKMVFKGVIFNVYHWKQKMFDGTYAIFEQLSRRDAVFVIPVTDDKKIIITRQKQPGREPYYAFAGGHIDDGESPLEAAKRELLEETGFTAENWSLMDALQPTSKADWAVYYFIAHNCKKIAKPKSDGGERVQIFKLSLKQLLKKCLAKNFAEREFKFWVYEALLKQSKMKKLIKTIFPYSAAP